MSQDAPVSILGKHSHKGVTVCSSPSLPARSPALRLLDNLMFH